MEYRDRIVNSIEKLIFGKHASANRNHIESLFKKLKEYDEKHPVRQE